MGRENPEKNLSPFTPGRHEERSVWCASKWHRGLVSVWCKAVMTVLPMGQDTEERVCAGLRPRCPAAEGGAVQRDVTTPPAHTPRWVE